MYEELIHRLREESEIERWLQPHSANETPKLLDDAADAIEELEKSIPRWIPVTERLPREEETVLTWGNQETILLDWRHDNKWCCFGEVTHWMLLPEPPKEET